MRVLILGGTLFIGRRIALELLARGDDVMVVHRGQTEPAELSGCAHVHVPRTALAEVADQLRAWRPDAVIDTRAMTAADASAVLPHLPDAHLVLLSSIDVYRAYELLLAGQGGEPVPLTESRRYVRPGTRCATCCPGWASTTTSSTWSRCTCRAGARAAAVADLRGARRAAAGGVRAAEGSGRAAADTVRRRHLAGHPLLRGRRGFGCAGRAGSPVGRFGRGVQRRRPDHRHGAGLGAGHPGGRRFSRRRWSPCPRTSCPRTWRTRGASPSTSWWTAARRPPCSAGVLPTRPRPSRCRCGGTWRTRRRGGRGLFRRRPRPSRREAR